MKLLLTSFWTSAEQDKELNKLTGKEPKDTKVAYIENACDIYDDEASLVEGRKVLQDKGYDFEVVDLRKFMNDREELQKKLGEKDVYWFTGGNPFYLRWLMKETGADTIIIEQMKKGKVYTGASAGGVISGPTLKYFDNQDDPHAAKEIIWEGLNLTDTVVVPHVDNKDFGAGCREAGEKLKKEGYKTQFITDTQALLINGQVQKVI